MAILALIAMIVTSVAPAAEGCIGFFAASNPAAGQTVVQVQNDVQKARVRSSALSRQEIKQMAAEAYSPQTAAWELRRQGRIKEADAVEGELKKSLRQKRIVQTFDLQSGKNGAKLVLLEDGTFAVWKPSSSLSGRGSRQKEIAAYLVDRQLELFRVPVTVERSLDGVLGSMQAWAHGESSGVIRPADLAFFDELIGNMDRHRSNSLRHDGQRVAIDNGASFYSLTIGEPNAPIFNSAVRKNLRRWFWRNPQASLTEIKKYIPSRQSYELLLKTTNSEWRDLLALYLTPLQIRAFLSRRDGIVTTIELARAEFGDDIFAEP